jgi:hypothetical protein
MGHLLTVEDRFLIQGRGVVVLPGLPEPAAVGLRPGCRVEIRRAGRPPISAKVGGLEVPTCTPIGRPLILLVGVATEDVPVGSEVWSPG